MKTLVLILSILFSLTGCNNNKIEKQEIDIIGLWNLTKYEPGFSPTENFNNGEISWTFQSTNKLQVQVSNSVNTPPLKKTGEYDFSINNGRILIDDIEYGFSINENKLILSDDPSADGFRATFTKRTE